MAETVTKKVDIAVGAPGAEKVPGLFQRIGHEIHAMNAAARGGGLHGIETILKGAGVAAFAHFSLEVVRAGADAWKDYAEGVITAQEAITKVAGSIPIIGSLVESTKSVAEAWLAFSVKHNIGPYHEAERYAPGVDFKGPDLPQQITDERAASKVFRDTLKEAHPELNPYLEKIRDVTTQIKDLRVQARQTTSGTARIEFDMAADNLEIVLGKTKEELHKAEQSFVRNLRINLVDEFKSLPRQAEQVGRDILKSAAAYSAHELEVEIDKMWEEFDKEKPFSIGMPSRTAPGVEGRFLTGAGGGGESPESKTAKNTEKQVGLTQEVRDAIKDLARAINQNSAQIVYVR